MRVRRGEVVGRVLVDLSCGLPVGLATDVSGGTEVWCFQGWRQRPEGGAGDGAYPTATGFVAPGGTPEVYDWEAERGGEGEGFEDAGFEDALAGAGVEATFDAGADPYVEVWRGEGGHVLVRPTLGGRDVGLFVLDTATACCVLAPAAVDAVGGTRFAEHEVLGQGGALATALVRGTGALALGGLRLGTPLFREMVLEGAVRGPSNWRGPGPAPRIAGVLGYDVLAHCSLTLTAGRREPGGAGRAAPLALRLGPPGADPASARVAVGFQALRFLARVPHLEASCVGAPAAAAAAGARGGEDAEDRAVEGAARLLAKQPVREADGPLGAGGGGGGEGVRERGLYKVALGVGGVAVVLGARTAARLGLGAGGQGTASLAAHGMVSAPGGRGAPLARLGSLEAERGVRTTRLARLETQGASFTNVRALWHVGGQGDPDDLELSCYAAGVLGADLFRDGCSLTLDYARRRASLAQHLDDPGHDGHAAQ